MALGLEGITIWAVIQSILLIISAFIIIIAAIGILRMDNDMPNVVYARIHILGMIDVAGILAFLGLGQPFFALLYLFLAPLLAHALANAYFHSEDDLNNPVLNPNLLSGESEQLDESEDLDLASNGDSGIDESASEEGSMDEGASEEGSMDEGASEEGSSIEDVDNKTTDENDEENLNNSEGDDND